MGAVGAFAPIKNWQWMQFPLLLDSYPSNGSFSSEKGQNM